MQILKIFFCQVHFSLIIFGPTLHLMACLHRRCDETRQFCLVSKFCSHRRQDSLVSSRPSFDEFALAVWTQLETRQNCLVLSLIVLTRQDETILSHTRRRCEQAITLLCLFIVSVVGKGFCVGIRFLTAVNMLICFTCSQVDWKASCLTQPARSINQIK